MLNKVSDMVLSSKLKYYKFSLSLCVFLLLHSFSFSQDLTIEDLQSILEKNNWTEANTLLSKKGWEYNSSKKGEDGYNGITWSYNLDRSNNKAESWIKLYTFNGIPGKIKYDVFNKSSYEKIQSELTDYGYSYLKDEIENESVSTNYKNGNFWLEITSDNSKNKDSSNLQTIISHSFKLINKGSVYDQNNGLKLTYHTNDTIKEKYTLKDGLINGIFKRFYDNGTLEMEGLFLNGKKDGFFTDYNKDGSVSVKYQMKNGETNGLVFFYSDGVLNSKSTYVKGEKNGLEESYRYDANGDVLIMLSGNMKDGLEDGKFHLYAYEKGEKRVLSYFNYEKGLMNGAFQNVTGDSLVVGTYNKGELDGDYRVYKDLRKNYKGGFIGTDTTKMKLVSFGKYERGNKIRHWVNYDVWGSKRNEGEFFEGQKDGVWKYYYSNYNSDGEGYDYSEELYLEENYYYGDLNGECRRYSILNREEYQCESLKTGLKDSTCFKNVYIRLLEKSNYSMGTLDGDYSLENSNGIVVEFGSYNRGRKEGEWCEIFNNNDFFDESKHDFVTHKGVYKDGEKQGKWSLFYDKSKTPFKSEEYNRGKLNKTAFLKEDGSTRIKFSYSHWGYLEKLFIYDENGKQKEVEVKEKTSEGFTCSITENTSKSIITQDFWVANKGEIRYKTFDSMFDLALKNGKAYKNGAYTRSDLSGNKIETGNYKNGKKSGQWIYRDPKQKVWYSRLFINGIMKSESFSTSNQDIFTGIYIHVQNNVEQIITVKKGLRHGKTTFVDVKSGKKIKKIKYKNGQLIN